MNVASLGEDAFARDGDYPVLWFEDRWYGTGELHAAGLAATTGLRRLGIGPGDRVVVTMTNCPEVGVTYSAIWRAGAVVVPVLFLLTALELRHIVEDCDAAAVITTPDVLGKVRDATDGTAVRHLIVAGGGEDVVDFGELCATAEPHARMHDARPDDVAVVFYTSGTTGRPKGVLLSHSNLIAGARNGHAAWSPGDGQVALACLPLAHVYGVAASLQSTFTRGTAAMLRWFDAGEALRLIEEFRVTITALVPTMMVYLLEHPDAAARDTSSLRWTFSGGAALPLEVQRAFEKRFGGMVLQGYGLSESAGQCSVNLPHARREGSVGPPVPGVEVRIVDEGGAVALGDLGEIEMRGPTVMLGYHRMPEATAAAMDGDWLRTGDIGRLDEEGFLHVVERKKDLIIRGGFNILPRDVEEVLHAHPAVAQAAVIGVPDARMGERVQAFVVLSDGARVSPDELVAFAREHLASYKCPSRIDIVGMLPVNATGKVLKTELRRVAQSSPDIQDQGGALVTDQPAATAQEFAALLDGKSDAEIDQLVDSVGLDEILRQIFEQMPQHFRADKAAGKNAVVQYDITASDGSVHSWQVTVENGTCTVATGTERPATVTLQLRAPDFLRLITGKMQGTQAFMTGKLKLQGDMMLAATMETWFERPS